MLSFFSLHSGSSPIAVRIAKGFIIYIPYLLIVSFFTLYTDSIISFNYEAKNLTEVILNELLLAARPIFLFCVPALFLTLQAIFYHTSLKKLCLFAGIMGLLLAVPSFYYNMKRWSIALQIIENLPLSQQTFSRWNGGFLSTYGMQIMFIIPDRSYKVVEHIITNRLPQSKSRLAQYPLLSPSTPEVVQFYIEKETPSGKLLSPYYYNEFAISKGIIRGTIFISL